MARRFKVETLVSSRQERDRLYQRTLPLFHKAYKDRQLATVTWEHAREVTETVSRYTAKAKDQEWASRCVLLSAIHPFDQAHSDDVKRLIPQHMRTAMLRSFNRFNQLRIQDEAPAEAKEIEVYRRICKPYVTKDDLALHHPETYVRLIDVSMPRAYDMTLHRATSGGSLAAMKRNLAESMMIIWRRVAIETMLFRCYDMQSNLAARILYPNLYREVRRIYKPLRQERRLVYRNFKKHLAGIADDAEAEGIPLVRQTDRETDRPTRFTIREKTDGSKALRFVKRGEVNPEESENDPDFRLDRDVALELIHDDVGATFVADQMHDAERLFDFIKRRDAGIIVEREYLFYGREDESGGQHSEPDYSGGHIDYAARAFGASNIKRTELQVRSYEAYLSYFFSSTWGRGARDSKALGDVTGDKNYKIVEALGMALPKPPQNERKPAIAPTKRKKKAVKKTSQRRKKPKER